MSDFQQFIDKIFWFLLLVVSTYIADQIRTLSKSVIALNEKIAVILVKIMNHGKELERHDDRIARLEQKKERN